MTLMPTRLWKQMTAEQRRRAASALWRVDDEATNDQMQAALLIAKQMKFRPKTVSGLDDDRKARYLASVPDLPRSRHPMLVLYHLAAQRPMMSAFLDALGIGHEHGLIGDDAVTPVRRKSLQLSRDGRGEAADPGADHGDGERCAGHRSGSWGLPEVSVRRTGAPGPRSSP